MLLSAVTPGVIVKGSRILGGKWHASLSAEIACALPVDNICELSYDKNIPAGMQAVDINRYDILSKTNTLAGVNVALSRALNRRYAIGVSAGYFRHSYADGVSSDRVDVSASFIF